jgi:superoxide dismutase, Cu-Zn family
MENLESKDRVVIGTVDEDMRASARYRYRGRSVAVATGVAVVLLMGCQPNNADRQDVGLSPAPDARFAGQLPDGQRVGQPVAIADSDAAPASRGPSSASAGAYAELQPVPGREARGTVEFVPTPTGVRVHARLTGLAPGAHGIHVHEVGNCTDPGETAGGHFSPQDNPHGSPLASPARRHAGDLGNIVANETGDAQLMMEVAGLEVEGARGVVGLSVVLHGGEDDFETQPDGDAGDPIACGVIHAGAAR